MSRPQAHFESPSGGFLDEIVTFVVNVVEVARDWIVSLWPPSVPASEATPVKDALKQASVAPPQRDGSSTSPNVPSGSVEEPSPLSDVGTLGNTEVSSVLPPIATDTAVQSQEKQLSYPATHDLNEPTIAGNVEESRAEVPLVQEEQAEPNANIHEISVANDSSQEWVSLSKPDAESPSIDASDVQPEEPTTSFVPLQDEDPQAEGSPSQQQETIVEPTLIVAPAISHESAMTTGSDTSTPPLSTPEPDTHSFDNAVRIQTDAEEQAPLNPESNVESGSVSELKERTSTPSLDDSASIPVGTGSTPELPAKKQRGGSFIKKQTTLMTKVFKSGNSKDARTNLTSPSKASLTVDNQSITSSLVSEPEAMENSTPALDASSADTSADKKIASPSRVSLPSMRSIGSIKKKFGRRGSTASDKDVVSAQGQESRSGTPEPLDVPSNSNLPSKVVDATSSGPSLLKTMFKVRKPLKVDDLRA